MYIPDTFRVSDPGRLHAFVRAFPFATLITTARGGEIEVSHIPLFLDVDRSQLRGHVARANPHWRAIGAGAPALVIFNGPQAYVTPQAYPGKREHGRVVPTWNYAVVHVSGQARAVSDPAWLAANVNELTDQQEAAFTPAWTVSDAPADYIEKLLAGIVGVEVAIARIEGKFKLSQNRAEPDRAGVIAELKARRVPPEHAMSALMEQAQD